MKQIAIDVKEFAVQVPRSGSIESGSGFGINDTTALGQKIHKSVQLSRKEQHEHYRAEVKISHKFSFDGYCITVSGRIDGLFEPAAVQGEAVVAESGRSCENGDVSPFCHVGPALQIHDGTSIEGHVRGQSLNTERETANNLRGRSSDIPHIEEIKSALSTARLAQKLVDPWHPYCLQVKTYAYLYWKQTGLMPSASLHLVSLENRDRLDIDVVLNIAEYEQWLARRLLALVDEDVRQEKQYNKRRRLAQKVELPFQQARSGQQELMREIEEGFNRSTPILVQAPTGLGKTMSVLLPSLKDALKRGQKLIYVTPKNSVHLVAEEAVERLRRHKTKIKSLTLTAKAKLCLKSEQICDPNVCEFAKNYYDKVADNGLLDKVAKAQHMSPQLFTEYGKKYTVCPFELSIDCIDRADVVICDYNHVFAPISLSGRLTAAVHLKKEKPNLVIDEAHNLHTRATGYFSACLSTKELHSLRHRLPTKEYETAGIIDTCVKLLNDLAKKQSLPEARVYPDLDRFTQLQQELNRVLIHRLGAESNTHGGTPLLECSYLLNDFCNAIDYTDSEQFYTCVKTAGHVSLKATCCDASKYLRQQYSQFQNVVAFSATLKPFQYYLTLSGFHKDTTQLIEATSPFPASNRKVIVIPQVSTKYRDRANNYEKICDAVQRISALKRANYILFFPSFDFLEQIANRLCVPEYKVLCQRRNMSRTDVSSTLEQLRSSTGHLLLVVQGGVFSEGLDFVGDMAEGAFIVGPGLPTFDLERELLREYYERTYGSGFEYAYSYPAMTKVIQSAGRIVRSETDRGLIVLFDRRFLADAYAQAMPADWYTDSPSELVSYSIISDITQFWQGNTNASG